MKRHGRGGSCQHSKPPCWKTLAKTCYEKRHFCSNDSVQFTFCILSRIYFLNKLHLNCIHNGGKAIWKSSYRIVRGVKWCDNCGSYVPCFSFQLRLGFWSISSNLYGILVYVFHESEHVVSFVFLDKKCGATS